MPRSIYIWLFSTLTILQFQTDSAEVIEDVNIRLPIDVQVSHPSSLHLGIGDGIDVNDRLRFHSRCGSLVKLSANCRTAG